jgi:hypothetical protein
MLDDERGGAGQARITCMKKVRWSSAVLLASAAILGSPLAAAQPQPGAGSTAPSHSVPDAAISEQAKQHFSAGVALLQDPEGEKVEEAYRQFKTAYDLSSSPKILGNMGFCAMRLERDGEAIDAYTRYLREVTDIDPDERAQIVRDLQTLTVGVARVTVSSNIQGAVVIDERVPVRGPHVTNTYGPINGKVTLGVRPGHHVFTVRQAGYTDATWEVEAFGGAKDEHVFTLKEAAGPGGGGGGGAERGKSNLGPILVVSAGAAMVVAGGITGMIALNKTGDIEDRCPNDQCPRNFDLDGQRSSARTFVRITDLLFLVGGVAVVTGLAWGLFFNGSEAKASPKAARLPTRGAGLPPSRSTFLSDWRLAL